MTSLQESNNQENTKQVILFFHPESQPCIKLREVVSKSTKNKKINFINIADVQTLPSNISSIPALLIDNKQVLLGKKVFNYFQEEDEFGYVSFSSTKNNSISNFSNINDSSEVDSNGLFSSIDAPDMSIGVPTYNEEDSNNIKLEDYTAKRAQLDSEIGIEKPKNY